MELVVSSKDGTSCLLFIGVHFLIDGAALQLFLAAGYLWGGKAKDFCRGGRLFRSPYSAV